MKARCFIIYRCFLSNNRDTTAYLKEGNILRRGNDKSAEACTTQLSTMFKKIFCLGLLASASASGSTASPAGLMRLRGGVCPGWKELTNQPGKDPHFPYCAFCFNAPRPCHVPACPAPQCPEDTCQRANPWTLFFRFMFGSPLENENVFL
jgi:hypothetical protein